MRPWRLFPPLLIGRQEAQKDKPLAPQRIMGLLVVWLINFAFSQKDPLTNPVSFLKFGKEHCSRSKGASRTGNHCASWTFLETVIQKEKLHADLGGTRLDRPMCCRDSKDGITRKSGTPYDCAKWRRGGRDFLEDRYKISSFLEDSFVTVPIEATNTGRVRIWRERLPPLANLTKWRKMNNMDMNFPELW